MRIVGILVFVLTVVLFVSSCDRSSDQSDPEVIPEVVDFNFHVRPVLSDKCYVCHGPDAGQRKAGLRLDIAEDAFAELQENPGHFALVPSDLENSEVYSRIVSSDSALMMPPPESNLKLTDREKQIIRKWIEQGAEYKPHWAFIAPEKKGLPEISDPEWVSNEIDYFILSRLDEEGLEPSKQAKPHTLARRVSLDITGLPPELPLESFEEESYDAYVDELLSSRHYGERMAQSWMDVARYADSHGYQDDSYRTMWPWRDWLIHAFNTNMSYKEFLMNQIAGDLLPDRTKETILATGFNRNHPITQEGGVINEEYLDAYVSDRTNTLGKGILGVTLECSKCHDHKYDPISQKEYFSMYAFFNRANERGLRFDAVQAASRKYYADAPYITITAEETKDIFTFINDLDSGYVNVMVMNDSADRETFVLNRGSYDQPTEKVQPEAPAFIMPFDGYSQDRLGLAEWLVDERNPLTARVFVNRIWAQFFGTGIVKTLEDFGMQGELPSHPDLLDWLTVDFMQNGWDVKYLIKKIVTSSTYRQHSGIPDYLKERDPENRLLARGPRFRMSSEMIRDYILSTSGLLNDKLGGPSVKPYQPPGLWEEINAGNGRGILTKYVQDEGDKLYRRSLYTFWKRTSPPPSMAVFDAPSRDLCEVRRQKTNTPLQALALQNDEQLLEACRVIAQDNETSSSPLEDIWKKVLLREPTEDELQTLTNLYEQTLTRLESRPEDAEAILDVGYAEKSYEDPIKTASLMLSGQALYNLDETITKE